MIFDSHTHYDDPAYDADRDELLGSLLPAGGVGRVVNVGASAKGTADSIALAAKYDYIYAATGIHPSEVMEYETGHADGVSETVSIDWLARQARSPKVAAIGEIGLDYHFPDDVAPEIQRKWFINQLQLAIDLNMPVIIHSRDAAQETYDIMSQMGGEKIKAVVHCFSYEPEMAERFLKLGCYIGIGGVLTYKNARKQVDVLRQMPLDRLLLETDCPYLSPDGHRGERNSSLNLPVVIAKMAEIRGLSTDEIENITYKNACEFYNIK